MESISFKGAFLVKNPTKAAKEQLMVLAGRRRQIFENFDNTTDVFYVVRPSKEEDIAKFIYDNNLHFKFFPRIGTKSNLDPLYPQTAVKKTQYDNFFIDMRDILAKKFKFLSGHVKYEYNIEGLSSAFGFRPEELSVSTKNGVTYAFTKDGQHIFKSSPVNKFGDNYVYFNDLSGGGKIKKLLVHGNKIIYEYPNNAKYFDDNFNNALII